MTMPRHEKGPGASSNLFYLGAVLSDGRPPFHVLRKKDGEKQGDDEDSGDHIVLEDIPDKLRHVVEERCNLCYSDTDSETCRRYEHVALPEPQSAVRVIPLTLIAPNMITVHPPRTHEGSVDKSAPAGGKSPAMMSVTAPNMIVKQLTTFVIAMRPSFWLKDVIGEHPKTLPDTADMKPSQQRNPEISFSVMSLPRPPVHVVVVSPIVSVAETRKTSVTEIMSSSLNYGV